MKRLSVFFFAAVALAASAGEFNGGRIVPTHRFVPVDRNGDNVSVGDRMPSAMSQEKTCAQCHSVDKMRGGSHFRSGSTNDAANKVNKEPWFLCSAGTGACKVVSLSDRGGLSAWEWVKKYGWAFPGGGIATCPKAMAEAAGDRQRWFVTGGLEMNCLACHSQDDYDVSEWAKQVLRENWSGAALAAAGYARVEGMNERLDASWDRHIAENPDDHLFKVPENIIYNPFKLDDKGRIAFRVGKPKNENCLACHSVAEASATANEVTGDVHLQRGMKCIDCHRNGMDHRIETKSCASCHMEKNGAGPKPSHTGIPLVHFQKLSCAVCHSGVTKGGKRSQIRTMRANRIGIYGRAQWATDIPFIEEPFVRKNNDGKVELCRRAALEGSNYVYWAFSHDVKPARMARGAAPERCEACHSLKSDFFAGYGDPVYFTAFNLAFLGRPMFKVVLWCVFALLCLFAAAAAAHAINRISVKVPQSTSNSLWRIFKLAVDAGFVFAVLYLAASGAVGWISGGMTWWWLMLHMVAGGALAAAVIVMAVLRHGGNTQCGASSAIWMVWLLLAAATVFTAVMPMMSVFGSEGQEFLLWAHRLVAFVFVAVSAVASFIAVRKRV
ncbi:MAG: cytochrome c3 family protein [Kiritimatiellae bacterium]|nr:cytochrome c3 family protein [Kiritimatiellia bacterium]